MRYLWSAVIVGIFGYLGYAVITGVFDEMGSGGRRGRMLKNIVTTVTDQIGSTATGVILIVAGVAIAAVLLFVGDDDDDED